MGTNAYQWLTQPPAGFENWEPSPEWKDTAFAKRRMFFERHASHRNGGFVCPACGYPTLSGRCLYDSCPICHWEDEGQDDPWGDQIGGPNDHSLQGNRIKLC